MISIVGVGKTDIGLRRTQNQDSIFVSNEPVGMLPNLYIVADGMGGHNAGNVASKYAIHFFCEFIKDFDLSDSNIHTALKSAVKYANSKVYEMSLENSGYTGMGTTLVALTIIGSLACVANVGDSRAYYLTENEISQITVDHSFVGEMVRAGNLTEEEAQNHPNRSNITRAVGSEENVMVDVFNQRLDYNSSVILCSDGLSNMLDNSELLTIANNKALDLTASVANLVESANIKGGLDNISVIKVLCEEVQ